jgi:hypothetical protein
MTIVSGEFDIIYNGITVYLIISVCTSFGRHEGREMLDEF